MTSSTENYKNEVIGSHICWSGHDNSHSRLCSNNDRIDLTEVIPLNDTREQLIYRPKLLRTDIKNLNLIKGKPLLDNNSIGNAKAYSTRSFFGAPALETFKNSEECLSKKNSVDVTSLQKTPFRRSSKIKFRELKRSMNLLDVKKSFRHAAVKSRKQRLKSRISAPILSPDIKYEHLTDMAPNIKSQVNTKVIKKLGREIEIDDQNSYTPNRKKRGFLRKKLLWRRNHTINKQKPDCQIHKTDIFIRCKNPNFYDKNGVNQSQKAIDFSDEEPSILIAKNCLTSENLRQDVEKIDQPLEHHKLLKYLDLQEYRKFTHQSSQNYLPISDNLTLEQTTKLPRIILNAVSTMESVSSPISNLSSFEDLEIISSSPLAQSTPRLFSRHSNNSEENNNYKVNVDPSLIMESLHKTSIFLDRNSAYERSISSESTKQELIKRGHLIARSRELKMMKKHPSPSKLELDRLQQALGRLS